VNRFPGPLAVLAAPASTGPPGWPLRPRPGTGYAVAAAHAVTRGGWCP
jgi:hypothetical protein